MSARYVMHGWGNREGALPAGRTHLAKGGGRLALRIFEYQAVTLQTPIRLVRIAGRYPVSERSDLQRQRDLAELSGGIVARATLTAKLPGSGQSCDRGRPFQPRFRLRQRHQQGFAIFLP